VSACVGAPQYADPTPPPSRYTFPDGGSSGSGSRSSGPVIAILRDERIHPVGGAYSFNLETANGISHSESGSSVQTAEGIGSTMTGEYSTFQKYANKLDKNQYGLHWQKLCMCLRSLIETGSCQSYSGSDSSSIQKTEVIDHV
ncbi:unnamed protein product, partial [Meganyctiphanes norvegica]